jgi:hypothetical protein
VRHSHILICRAIDDALFDFVLAVNPRSPFATVRIFYSLPETCYGAANWQLNEITWTRRASH